MNKFSLQSISKLEETHPALQELFHEVLHFMDCTILEGHRNEERQDDFFKMGKSELKWPDSKHNSLPSMAVDVAPYPIDWTDTPRFYHFAGIVLGIASQVGVKIRWGGDWDGDKEFKDQTFNDLVHFELVGV